MIHLYTGEGKGKTTAAVGLAVRASGHKMPVFFAQFMKGNDTGELHSLQHIEQVHILRSDRNFGFYNRMSEADKQEITRIHDSILDRLLEEVEKAPHCLIVLDEITYPVKWNLLCREKLQALLRYQDAEIVMTGREPAAFLQETADYITEMKCVRHPYEKGVQAREGIEY